MKIYFLSILLALSVPALSGCVPVIVGSAVAGGIVVSQDRVQLQANGSFINAFQITQKTLERMGMVHEANKSSGIIDATVQESHVVAHVEPVSLEAVRIEIKARKNMLPDTDLANKIIRDIQNQLRDKPAATSKSI